MIDGEKAVKTESITIRNYKIFQKAEVTDLPDRAVLPGKNGGGRTMFFDVFGILHDCLNGNVKFAPAKRGGCNEVVSQDHNGENISLFIKFRPECDEPLMTYELCV